MPVIARTGAMLVIGHKAPMETSAIACRIESLNQRRKADRLKQVSGPQRCRPTLSRLVTHTIAESTATETPDYKHAQRPPRGRLRCVLSMFSSLRVKVPAQPDGGEGLEMMQGLPPRGGV